MKKLKPILIILVITSLVVSINCAKKENKNPKKVAKEFIVLQQKHKYQEAYDNFYPKEAIGGYKEFKNTSKRVFDNFRSFKFTKEDIKNRFIVRLGVKDKSWLIYVQVTSFQEGTSYVTFGEWLNN